MTTDINSLINEIKKKKRKSTVVSQKEIVGYKKVPFFISKILILVVLFLGVLIYTKSSASNKMALYDQVFNQNISFAAINNLYNKYLGGILPFKNLFNTNKPVFNEKLSYKEANLYKDGVCLIVTKNYLVPIQESGIVVYIGDKEDYGKTVIVQQVNGIDLWYGNVENINIKIYDYVEKGSLLGETIDNRLYLVYEKEGKKLDYKEYLK